MTRGGAVGARWRLTGDRRPWLELRANGLDLRADGVSVAAFDFEPDSCVLELASSDNLADAISDQLARARRPPARRAAACLDYAVPTISPRSPTGSNSEPQTGQRIGFAVRAAQTRLARQTFQMPHRQTLLVVRTRQVGIARIARTVRVCLGPRAIRSSVQASSGINCRREPPRSAIAGQLAASTRCRTVLRPRHGLQAFRPSLGSRGRKRARTPARSIRSRRDHRAGGVTPVEVRHRPRSQNR